MFRTWRIRNPLLFRGALALVVMGVARLGVALGWLPDNWALDEARVEQIFDGIIAAWAWFSSRAKVTPVADPRNNAGATLVPTAVYPPGPRRP